MFAAADGDAFESGADTEPSDVDLKSETTTTKQLDEQLIGIIIGGMAVTILLLMAVVLLCIVRRRNRKKYAHCGGGGISIAGGGGRGGTTHHVALNYQSGRLPSGQLGGIAMPPSNGKLLNGMMYNSIVMCDANEEEEAHVVGGPLPIITNGTGAEMYREPYDIIQMRKLPELPVIPVDTVGKTVKRMPPLEGWLLVIVCRNGFGPMSSGCRDHRGSS